MNKKRTKIKSAGIPADLEPRQQREIEAATKMVKAIRRQADAAERIATTTADVYVAEQMRSLAQAFCIQADTLKKKKKKKK